MDPPEGIGQFNKERKLPDLKISAATLSSIAHPKINQDAMYHDSKNGEAMLFDGMGGYVDGDKASLVAQESILHRMRSASQSLQTTEEWKKYIRDALLEANQKVSTEVPGGGTTATVMKMIETEEGTKAVIGNVGDSRAYLLRDGKLQQITEDDNIVSTLGISAAEKARINQNLDNLKTSADLIRLSETEKYCFENRNYISQSLGGNKPVYPRVYEVSLRAGDKIILTSDGVSDNLTASELEDLVRSPHPDLGAVINSKAHERSMMDRSEIVRAKPDDITCLVVEVGGKPNEKPGEYDAIFRHPRPERRPDAKEEYLVDDLNSTNGTKVRYNYHSSGKS